MNKRTPCLYSPNLSQNHFVLQIQWMQISAYVLIVTQRSPLFCEDSDINKGLRLDFTCSISHPSTRYFEWHFLSHYKWHLCYWLWKVCCWLCKHHPAEATWTGSSCFLSSCHDLQGRKWLSGWLSPCQLLINSPLSSNTCFPETLFLSVGEERRGLINQLLIVLCRKPRIVPVNCYPFSFSAGIFLSKIFR